MCDFVCVHDITLKDIDKLCSHCLFAVVVTGLEQA